MTRTITVTWADNRIDSPFPGVIRVAVWANHGNEVDLFDAIAYADYESRKSGTQYRVHTFEVDDSQWRAKSVAAHDAGKGL